MIIFREKIRFLSFESTDDINRQIIELLKSAGQIIRQYRIFGQKFVRFVAIPDVFNIHDISNEIGNGLDKWLGTIIVKPIFVDEYSAEATKELGVTNHEVSALTFFLRIIEWMTATY